MTNTLHLFFLRHIIIIIVVVSVTITITASVKAYGLSIKLDEAFLSVCS